MGSGCSPLVLIGAGAVLLAVLSRGILALVKIGIRARYALSQEPQDEGVYDLDQSQEAGDQ